MVSLSSSASDRVHDECRRSPGLRCHAAAHGAGKVKAASGSITSAEIHIRCRGQNNKSVHTAHHCALCLLLGVLQIVDSVDSVLPVSRGGGEVLCLDEHYTLER